MSKHKSFDLRDGVDLLEKYVGKDVEVYASGKKVLHTWISGKLEVEAKKYFVKSNTGCVYFWFFNVLWLQESLVQKFKWDDKKKKSIKVEEIDKLNIFLHYDMEDEIEFWQKTSRELENKV